MTRICFISYEIHPTTWGGCGVLLHHAAELLLKAGHEITFLLDIPLHELERFRDADRLAFSNAENCKAFHVDTLCWNFPYEQQAVPSFDQWKALRFAHALEELIKAEGEYDFVEIFEYCGVSYYALVQKLFGQAFQKSILGTRIHNSLELIDQYQASNALDRHRYLLYALEHAGMNLSESVLIPTNTYYREYYQHPYQLPPARVVKAQSPKLEFPAVTRRPAKPGSRITYFGRIFQFKGVDKFIDAAILLLQKRPDLQSDFELIGYDSNLSPTGGSYIEYLRNKVPLAMRDRFIFTGHLTHDVVAQRLNDTLFAVFPNYFESFCYAVHEIYDAGVPVVVNDLPGWSDFFVNERNALVCDGTTEKLVEAMERMYDDDALRERMTKPYIVADEPLGTYYEQPKVLSPLRVDPAGRRKPRVLVLVLHDSMEEDNDATLSSLSVQTHENMETICLYRTQQSDEDSFRWLGAFWRARRRKTVPIAPLSIATGDALLILRNGDVLDRRWIELCAGALAARPAMAFAGTWYSVGGVPRAYSLDLMPELFPLHMGCARLRVLLRTDRGLLIDLFDPNLDALGEVGYLWKAVARWGQGCLLPSPMLELPDDWPVHAGEKQLGYLFNRYGEPFASRLFKIVPQLMMDAARSAAAEPQTQVVYQSAVVDDAMVRSFAESRLRLGELCRLLLKRIKLVTRTQIQARFKAKR